MEFSDEVLQQFSISKGLVEEDGTLNLYVNGAFKEVTDDEGLIRELTGDGVRVAIAANLVGSYDPDSPGTADTSSASGLTSTQDFFDSLTAIFESYATGDDDEEVQIEEEILTPSQIEDLVPWLAGKGDLLNTYTEAYVETGNGDFSIAAVRQSEDYAKYYPGITRDDGSLRMNETQYEQTREGYFRILLENGLNPTVFDSAGKVAELIAGDVDVPEFRTRVEATRRAFIDNIKADEIKAYYQANFGVDLSDNAVFAAALDPDMSRAILLNQIDVSELGAEAALRNLDLNTDQAQRLLQAGITEEGSTRLFARSADQIRRLSELSAAQGRNTPINLQQQLDVQVFQDPTAIEEQNRILQQQQSASSAQMGAAKTQTGEVAGLEER